MATHLRALENRDPTRFRYLSLRDGQQSFPDFTRLEVGDTQDQLEELFAKVFVYEHDNLDDPNLVTALVHEGMALDQAILRIVPLERR